MGDRRRSPAQRVREDLRQRQGGILYVWRKEGLSIITDADSLLRSHSPALGVHSFSGIQRFNFSSYTPSPKRLGTSNSPNSTSSDFFSSETEPIVPELCIDHPWTETIANTREKNSQATKVFLTTDLCGQKFLCFLVESQHQLRMVKFEESNDKSQLIFGSISNISAKDAAPVESINTMVVLEINGNLILYTGVVKSVNAAINSYVGRIASTSPQRACASDVPSLSEGPWDAGCSVSGHRHRVHQSNPGYELRSKPHTPEHLPEISPLHTIERLMSV
ncbi:unnamed protein product [Ranitomeya imitator]|uniref:Uncharacterized protein n=1 Tax=Ranitomeya imitator TaxID=111125 RepID=A0ABN9L2U4_9NEOB|nr:unnamed protein product [Ranitomeya imitator]